MSQENWKGKDEEPNFDGNGREVESIKLCQRSRKIEAELKGE